MQYFKLNYRIYLDFPIFSYQNLFFFLFQNPKLLYMFIFENVYR